MTETVADAPVDESEAPEEQPTPPEDDLATVKKRLAGKDQALTRAQQEAKDAKAEAESLRRWKAEKEQADMTEVERLQRERDEAKADAAKARRDAELASLAVQYPDGGKLWQDLQKHADDPAAQMAYLQGIARAQAAAATEEPEPSVNLADRPRRTPPTPAQNMTREQLVEQLKGQIMAELG